jgi:CRP-like cAMP-binding protein
MQRKAFKAGETIFKSGDNSDLAYVIVIGGVDISVHGEAGELKIASLAPGEVFGEMGLIDDGPRSADAIANQYTVCAGYDGDELLGLLDNNPGEAVVFIKTLIRRLREANRSLTAGGS